MNVLAKLTWIELKLFLREPLTVLFAIVLPLMVLFVMGGVFGNQPDAGFYRGVGAMNYYLPAYIALVTASVGLISLPAQLSGYRERGVLKRYRSSGVPTWVVISSQIAVAFLISLASALILVLVARPTYDVVAPASGFGVAVGFVVVALLFSTLGVLIGAVIPSSRAAQALGVLLWFVMLMVGGAGPPPEVLTGAVGVVGDVTPLRHAIVVMQNGWLGLDPGYSWLVAIVLTVVCAVVAGRLFRWD